MAKTHELVAGDLFMFIDAYPRPRGAAMTYYNYLLLDFVQGRNSSVCVFLRSYNDKFEFYISGYGIVTRYHDRAVDLNIRVLTKGHNVVDI